MATEGERLRLAVGIATAGRPAVLAQVIERLARQTRRPDRIFICAPTGADVAGIERCGLDITVIVGPRGSSVQRNVILQLAGDYELMMFFDDDFVPCEDYLASFERIMVVNPDVVLTTGRVLKDGILGPGLAIEVADDILAAAASEPAPEILETAYNGYGCNMGVRLRPVREHGIGFDERLALYGWLEDVDFSRHLARFGRVVSAPATRGVHLGVKLGRQPGLRLGYSQIANPVYLIRKGTMSPRRALRLMVRNLLANACRVWRPEPWVDRSGRLHGNLKAVFDLALGRLDPARVASL